MPSKRCAYKGIIFASLAEAGYYIMLLDKERKGYIKDIKIQPSWDLMAFDYDAGYPKKIGKYTADFSFVEIVHLSFGVTGRTRYIDIKGQVPKTITQRNGRKKRVSGGKGWTGFKLRIAIMWVNYGIEIEVVEGAPYTKLAYANGVDIVTTKEER